ncbi:MAG TPA: hypothetical protein VNT26_16070, partial [Candidatus Sulfotelmatobacter sp.]|nr:hypothetical protein [Candidatus Sulfotelmatobacter sp.]
MKGADRLQQGKSSLELIEEAVHLLRTAPASTLAYYYVGALPFVLGALYFWADMSRSAEAYQHLETASLSMALLFAWMKFWQAVFGHSLRTLMLGHSPAPWSFRRGWRLFLTQTALQPTGLLALPLAFLLLVPFGWVYAFYQNLTVLADNETTELRAVAKAAGRQATLWSRQNHLLLAILFGFGGCVLVNWSTVCYLLPGLVKTLFGLDSTFSRSGHSLLNSTFFAAMFGLTYLCVDPILKASYALRCFYGQSLQSGEDLKAELKPFGAPSRVAAGIVFALFVTAMGLEAGETRNPKSEIRNNSEAFNFNIEGSKPPCACLESILVGFGRPTAASARQPYRDKFLTGPVPEAPLRIAQCFNIGIRVPKESFRSEGTGEPSAPHSGLPFGTWMVKGDASPSVENAGLFSDVPPGQRDSDKSSVEHSQLSSSKLDRTIQEVLQQRKYTWRMPREKRVEPEQAEKGVIGRFLEKIGNLLRKWLKALGSWLEEWLRKLFQRQQTQSPPTSSGYGWILSQQLLLYLLVTAVVV